jgi:hypothetical protein
MVDKYRIKFLGLNRYKTLKWFHIFFLFCN